MAKPWGGVKSWAADAEEEEQRKAAAAAADVTEFPSLSEAVTNKSKKKTKGQTVTLQQLQQGIYAGPRGSRVAASDVKGLTTQEMMALPTGPRERTGEEDRFGRLGGGFSDYGRGSGGASRFENKERRGYGGFDDERRQRGSDREIMSSRADEVDNWGATKKAMPPPDQYEKRRYSEDRFEGTPGGGSRADEVDNWGAAKKFQPSTAPPPSDRKSMGFGSSYRDSSDSDRWGSRRESIGERPRVVLDPPRAGGSLALSSGTNDEAPRASRPSPFGNARPREEVLAEKRKDEVEVEVEGDLSVENKDQVSRPGSSHSSHPESPRNRLEVAIKPKPKINPFGQARPREEVLKEQGKDYKKIDFELEHRGIERPETEEEINLKQEISALKEDLANHENRENKDVNGEGPIGDQPTLSEMISKKEKALELLTRELDDKVRFVKRSGDRPGSAAGRGFESLERPMSQSGRSDSGRSFESFDSRPRSRGGEAGGPDIWRSGDERRGGGYRDRNFSFRDRAPDSRRW